MMAFIDYGFDYAVHVVDLDTKATVLTHQEEHHRYRSVHLTRDGKYAILYEELDSVVRFLSLETQSIAREYRSYDHDDVEYETINLAVSDDLKYIVTTSWRYLDVWDYETNEKYSP